MELLKDVELAVRLSVSRRAVWMMHAAGQIPEPVRLGRRSTRWQADEIEFWIELGCPNREEFEAACEAEDE